MSTIPSRAYGKVYLVGAGPGDPGLLTVRGKACLQAADCVVYDALVNPALLALAPRAELVYAGKQAGRHSLPQGDINTLLLSLAERHAHIVRLKGGDPFVFGRGGEEALALRAAGISFEVVPGVTSGIAVPAYAGIPVTHRGLTRGVTLVTGHTDEQGRFLLEADDLPRRGTVVVYMGVRSLAAMVRVLRESGRAGDTPAALLASGTYATQRVLVSTIDAIEARALEEGIAPPALLIVGEVISLRESLAWFEHRPLFSVRILLTHARREEDLLAQGLSALGAEVLVMPSLAFEATSEAAPLSEITASDWVVLTSANAVSYLFERLRAGGADLRALRDVRLIAVGRSARQALEARAAVADASTEGHEPEAVAQALKAAGAPEGARLVVLRSDLARRAMTDVLARSGYVVTEVTAYTAAKPLLDEGEGACLRAFAPQLIVFTNGGAVRNFQQVLGTEAAARLVREARIASIGAVTSLALRDAGIDVDIEPAEPGVASLVDAIATNWVRR
jgi:uroporphyrinogen III methyltransferase/synthase